MKKLLIAVAMCVSAPAMAADQFDLICVGTSHVDGTASDGDYSDELQIDLKNAKYCYSSHCVVKPILSLQADNMVLEDQHSDVDQPSIRVTVNRETGVLSRDVSRTRVMPANFVLAQCKLAPFKPFGSLKTLF